MHSINQFPPNYLNSLPKEDSCSGDVVFTDVSMEAQKYSQLLSSIRFIDDNLSQNLKIKDIASHVHMSESNFARLFRFVFKVAPYQYIMKRKMEISAQLLVETSLSISSIAYHIGFSDIASFSRSFKLFYKLSPSDYRSKGTLKAAEV